MIWVKQKLKVLNLELDPFSISAYYHELCLEWYRWKTRELHSHRSWMQNRL